jgi:hypothetical protein
MNHRVAASDAGWALAKAGVLLIILFALAGFTLVSNVFGRSRAGRITCLDNQRAMRQALVDYQMENAGTSPRNLMVLRHYYSNASGSPGRCPVDVETRYSFDPATGRIECLNPDHHHGL